MVEDRQARVARFDGIFAAHFDAVRAYAWRRRPQAADDIAAETFAIAWRRLEDVPAEALPWLFAVARHVVQNLQRAERRRLAGERRGARPEASPSCAEAFSERSALGAALRRLPERDREILLLVAWERLDRAALAATLDCSKATAAVRLFRARKRLEAALRDAESQPLTVPADVRGRLLDESYVLSMLRAADPAAAMPAMAPGDRERLCRAIAAQQRRGASGAGVRAAASWRRPP